MSHPFVRVIFSLLFLRQPQAETGASLCVGKLAMEGGCQYSWSKSHWVMSRGSTTKIIGSRYHEKIFGNPTKNWQARWCLPSVMKLQVFFRVVSGDYGLNPMISFETTYSSCCFFLARHAEGVHHWLLGDSVVRVGAAGYGNLSPGNPPDPQLWKNSQKIACW